MRKSSYGSVPQSASQPALANYGNLPDPGYGNSPPVRPTTGSRPVSPGSLGPAQPQHSGGHAQTNDVFGTGPKTFQEMGIPTNQKKDDCLIM
jgi:hypothetical protein